MGDGLIGRVDGGERSGLVIDRELVLRSLVRGDGEGSAGRGCLDADPAIQMAITGAGAAGQSR